MPCDQCADALAKGRKFCNNCGTATGTLSVEALNKQVVDLTAQVSELLAERNSSEQKFLEVDTAQNVVDRLMGWAKLFGFFVGIPIALVLIGLSIWAGKSIKDFHDLASAGQASVNATLEKAKLDAKTAEAQAAAAVTVAQDVNKNIKDTHDRLTTLTQTVQQSSEKVGQLNTGVSQQEIKLKTLSDQTTAQGRVVQNLGQQVQAYNKTKIEQDIGQLHPEFGTRFVGSQGGEVITVTTKPANTTYAQLDVFNQNPYQPKLTQSGIASGVQNLQQHGFHIFIGQVSLQTKSGNTSTSLAAITVDMCHNLAKLTTSSSYTAAPCIMYFQENGKAKALEARQLLSGIEDIPEDRVRYIAPSALNPAMKELIDKSGLDMSIVLGP